VSGKTKGGFNPRQLQIDWNGVTAAPPVDSSARPIGDEESPALAPVPKPEAHSAVAEEHQPVLRLRWDFRTRFPQPLPDAVDAGVMTAEDALPRNVEAIHQEHGRKMLGALSDLDAAMDERRNDPSALARPRDGSMSEPTRLERWYSSLLGVYEDWFGKEAAEAFDRAVRAWHAHVEVVVDRDTAAWSRPMTADPITVEATESREVTPPVIDAEACEADAPLPPSRRLTEGAAKRVIARLPVPRPLPSAVTAGHFGMEDDGRPVRPSADEVRDITVNHAEELIELLGDLEEAQRRKLSEDQCTARSNRIEQAVQKYAEDFGGTAAEQLRAYCNRQLRLGEQQGRTR
jgi:hypothetical protein